MNIKLIDLYQSGKAFDIKFLMRIWITKQFPNVVAYITETEEATLNQRSVSSGLFRILKGTISLTGYRRVYTDFL